MNRKILFLLDPLGGLHHSKDTSLLLMQSFALKGYSLFVAQAESLVVSSDSARLVAQSLELGDIETPHFIQSLGEPEPMNCYDFGLMVFRTDPPFDQKFLSISYLLSQLELRGVKVCNSPQGIRNNNEKITQLPYTKKYGVDTLVTLDKTALHKFWHKHRDIVVKPLDGMGGQGIFQLLEKDANFSAIYDSVSNYGSNFFMAQKLIPEYKQGDKRVIVIDGVPQGYGLLRLPQDGEARANLMQGGKGVAQCLSDKEFQAASEIGSYLKEQGIVFAGLDFIGGKLTEVNVTSPTGLREIFRQTGNNYADRFVEACQRIYCLL